MCYSAQIWQSYRKYVRVWGADVNFDEFKRLYWDRQANARIRIAKAMDAGFADPQSGIEREIQALIEQFDRAQVARFETEIFKQRKRLADAERTLQTKTTKAALESRRIATEKVEWALGKLADLRRAEPNDEDHRIFPGWYAPVMVLAEGRKTLRPMRYQCRLPGKPAFHDTRFPGTYNARRDNLGGYWRDLFGKSHAIIVANAFFENVSKHDVEGRELAPGEKEENVVLEFRPRPRQDMYLACLWSHWQAPNEPGLLSFAAITDDPPPEVAAAGHDRCVIPIDPDDVDEWLAGGDLRRMQAILDRRARPHYEYRLAA